MTPRRPSAKARPRAPAVRSPSGWTDTSVADGGNYFYVVYADNGYFCTPTVSGAVVTKATPGQASGTVTVARNGTSGQFDIRIDALKTAGTKYPDTVFQYQLGGGAWTTVVPAGDWITSMADSSVYGNPITVTLRACRDAAGGFCGEPSATDDCDTGQRAGGYHELRCGSGSDSDRAGNAGAPVVTYTYSFQDALGLWAPSSDAVPPAGTRAVRVKATVQVGTGSVLHRPRIRRRTVHTMIDTQVLIAFRRRGNTMTMTPEQATWFSGIFGRLVANVEQVLLGKTFVIRLAFTALLSEGHLLLEDFPGTGKTSLARAIAQSVDGSNNRVQFTPDLLPGDITGVSIYDQRSGDFEFHKGPIFANIVLAPKWPKA